MEAETRTRFLPFRTPPTAVQGQRGAVCRGKGTEPKGLCDTERVERKRGSERACA